MILFLTVPENAYYSEAAKAAFHCSVSLSKTSLALGPFLKLRHIASVVQFLENPKVKVLRARRKAAKKGGYSISWVAVKELKLSYHNGYIQ